MHHPGFQNRRTAGASLGIAVGETVLDRPLVLGLPRGGVPVAAEVATAIHAPLDVVVVRKLGVPRHAELAMGAIGENAVTIVNADVIRSVHVTDDEFAAVEQRERCVLERMVETLRVARPAEPLIGRDAIIVDDGIATGATTRAAIRVVRAGGARRVVVATPVAPTDVVTALRSFADLVVCLLQPCPFGSVGRWYRDFDAVGLDEVLRLLADACNR